VSEAIIRPFSAKLTALPRASNLSSAQRFEPHTPAMTMIKEGADYGFE
jgi:hypothetical protein